MLTSIRRFPPVRGRMTNLVLVQGSVNLKNTFYHQAKHFSSILIFLCDCKDHNPSFFFPVLFSLGLDSPLSVSRVGSWPDYSIDAEDCAVLHEPDHGMEIV